MFEELGKNTHTVWIEKPTKGVFATPNGDARLVCERLWWILCWINDEFLADAANEDKTETQFPEPKFSNRSISRTVSYVIHACLLEGILEKMYANMFVTLNHYGISGITPDDSELTKRADEMKDIVEFRNTVAAHTAYADPHPKKDDFLSEINSLFAFLSVGINSDNGSFFMNAVAVTNNGTSSKRTIPIIGLRDIHTKVEPHFKEWEKMFVTTLKEVDVLLPIYTPEYRIEKRA